MSIAAKDHSILPNAEVDLPKIALTTDANTPLTLPNTLLTLANVNGTFQAGETLGLTGPGILAGAGTLSAPLVAISGSRYYVQMPPGLILLPAGTTVTGPTSAATATVNSARAFDPKQLLLYGSAAFVEGENACVQTNNLPRAATTIHPISVSGRKTWNVMRASGAGTVTLYGKCTGAM